MSDIDDVIAPSTDEEVALLKAESKRGEFIPPYCVLALIARMESKEIVAWRYKRLGRPNWNVTNNSELVAGLSAKGSHTVQALGVIHELSHKDAKL